MLVGNEKWGQNCLVGNVKADYWLYNKFLIFVERKKEKKKKRFLGLDYL